MPNREAALRYAALQTSRTGAERRRQRPIQLATPKGDPRHRVLAASLAAVSAPLSILVHEVGHFVCYVFFGFPSPRLHYGSAGWDGLRDFNAHLEAGEVAAAQELASLSLNGWAAAAGPAVTYLMIGLGLWMLYRFESLVGAALTVGASARVIVLLPVLLGRSEGTDEARVSLALSIPEFPLHLLGHAAAVRYLGHRCEPRW